LPIVRSFVYLDISDFSKIPDGVQLLVIQSLLNLSAKARVGIGSIEAELCIGDGYIYVWDSPRGAVWYASKLAKQIEEAVANERSPEFHFRIGVHVGPVRCFLDPGRKNWNYVGDGINGGNRVLNAIGKETDDVVFVSGQVRNALLKDTDPMSKAFVAALLNRGRKKDKHDKPWRVYELNHTNEV
jgi:class 3 adenylate cyclase